jgi:acetyl esterase/lipase
LGFAPPIVTGRRFLGRLQLVLPLVYLLLSLVLLINTLGVVAPRHYGSALGLLGAIPFIVTMMMAPHILLGGLLLSVCVAAVGGLASPLGQVGLGLHLLSWALLLKYFFDLQTAYPRLDGRIIKDSGIVFPGEQQQSQLRISFWPYLRFQIPAMAAARVERSIVYRQVAGVRLRLDCYRPRQPPAGVLLPSILYIHGGAWVAGNRRQSPFMMYELAAAGYVVFAVEYRLAPRFPLPAGLEDVKAAVVWVRQHAAEYGGTADAVVMGGSAGAHLAAMLTTSPNQPRFQPGFEAADTSVRGAVLLYGLYDFASRLAGKRHFLVRFHWFMESVVFGAEYHKAPERFHALQPATHLSAATPPTLLIHGESDSLVPLRDSQDLHRQLKQAGARSHLCEVPLAQHAFELVPSPLHQRTLRIISHFLASL